MSGIRNITLSGFSKEQEEKGATPDLTQNPTSLQLRTSANSLKKQPLCS
jgi:hypothetical protein